MTTDLLTREEYTALELAVKAIPTKERRAKGDIVIHGPADMPHVDVVNERSNIPTARSKVRHQSKLYELFRDGIIDANQYVAGNDLRTWWKADRDQVIIRQRIATWQSAGLPRGEWRSVFEELEHRLRCYAYLRNPDNGLSTAELNKLESVVCLDEPIRKTMGGFKTTQTARFTALMQRLCVIAALIHQPKQ